MDTTDEFEIAGKLLRELYATMTVKELRKELHCGYYVFRRALWEHHITPRKRGRYAMHTFKLTEPIFHAICVDGVPAVAQRIGITSQRLLQILKTDPRVKEWEQKYQKVLGMP